MTLAPRARVGALALAVAGVLAACGGDDDESPSATASPSQTSVPAGQPTVAPGPTTTSATGTSVSITVRGGSVEGPSRQRVSLNQRVVLRVTSDVADEVHVHGYDLTEEVGPARVAEITFVANIPGVFEVELERAHRRLTTLEVQP